MNEPIDRLVLHAYRLPGKPHPYVYLGSIDVNLMDGVFEQKDITIAATRYKTDLCNLLGAKWNDITITYDLPESLKFVNELKALINIPV